MFVYLILHYKNADLTEVCLDSLNKIERPDSQIVVVDNASNNGSFELLMSKYEAFKDIHFIGNEKNLGYAEGNNVGFRYAKETLGADWIVLLNNDVLIEQKDFQTIIEEKYKENPFFLAGPDIVTPKGESQNPFLMICPDKKAVIKKLVHDYAVFYLMKVHIQQLLKKITHYDGSIFQPNNYDSIIDFSGVLHGSCLIFSPDFVEKYNGLYRGTFLYCEEEILCYIMKKKGHRYSYIKELRVTHKHSMSMKREIKDEDKRKILETKRRIDSYKKFLKIINSKKDMGEFLI